MLSTVERQNQSQSQQLTQVSMPATYHVPRGPAAVANISAPRSTVATPIVRANTGQTVPITRSWYVFCTYIHKYLHVPKTELENNKLNNNSKIQIILIKEMWVYVLVCIYTIKGFCGQFALEVISYIIFLNSNTTISNPQWQPKTTSVVYAQPQRHPTPPVNRVSRPSSVYTGQQPRLITPTNQGRSVQATITGSPSRLITPILQTNNSITTRLPLAQSRPPTPQVVTVTQTSQPGRSSTQTIQVNESSVRNTIHQSCTTLYKCIK